tara:strand:- start:65955 stop:66587 length:633 start_codon:yes stop_codon:yes gene_type:complete
MPSKEQPEETSSGLSKLPSLIAYPRIPTLKEVEEEMAGQFVYVVKGYEEEGLCILIKRDPHSDEVFLKIGDFDGEPIILTDDKHPLQETALRFAAEESSNFVEMMRMLGIEQMIFYISVTDDGMKLVDLRASIDKFYGPGMIRDLFAKIFPVQEVIKTTNVTVEVLEAIYNNEGSFQGDIILKCSKFKTVVKGKELLPLYAKIKRKKKRE